MTETVHTPTTTGSIVTPSSVSSSIVASPSYHRTNKGSTLALKIVVPIGTMILAGLVFILSREHRRRRNLESEQAIKDHQHFEEQIITDVSASSPSEINGFSVPPELDSRVLCEVSGHLSCP